MSSEDRLKTVVGHLATSRGPNSSGQSDSFQGRQCSATSMPPPNPSSNNTKQSSRPKPVDSAIPKFRQDLLKWNGWGYKDSQFIINGENIAFTGTRYRIGQLDLPYFTDYVKTLFEVDLNVRNLPQPMPTVYPEPTVDQDFLADVRKLNIPHSMEGIDRLFRAHGHTLHDIFVLRTGMFERIPDIVVWPECHDHVVSLVELANRHNVVVIPFGGGTSVSLAVCCPPHERRTILSLDTSQMNRILWVDTENLVACIESGIIGQDLEREMQSRGLTCGHEPDSYEFSSLGGWVATRASGMKKNTYGNIEDLVVHVRMVTPAGVLEKGSSAPRISCGPDFNHVVLGSEGTLGVITEVTMKVRPLPKVKRFGSVAFPNFESGVACMREVARRRCQPASIRLMDNEQFKFGQALRPVPSYWGLLLDGLKRAYITRIKGFNVDHMCVATLLFEGDATDVEAQEKLIYKIAVESGGIPAGETNGERGYTLTFVIAYIRDLALEYDIVAESFETSVAWDRTVSLCRNVKHRVAKECQAMGVERYHISSRVTQTYDSGSCVYFYFGFKFTGQTDPLATYEHIEEMAREEILASGGSLSHHHGIGKLRSKWLGAQVSPLGVSLYHATKAELDPNNIFASGNLHQRKANL